MENVLINGKVYEPLTNGKNYWECEVDFMHGDADLYTSEVYRWNTIEEVERFFDVCNQLPKRTYVPPSVQLKEWVETVSGFRECFTSFESMEDFKKDWGGVLLSFR